MQNQYLGDIGDFGKLGLLRALAAGESLGLGVVWYLVPDEGGSSNGRHTAYLGQASPALRDCDPELFDALAVLVQTGPRDVREVESRSILPSDTAFFTEPLAFEPGASLTHRKAYRAGWLARALKTTAGCDLVFLDPDNGLESGTGKLAKRGCKYVFLDELRAFIDRKQSVVVYHHLDRTGPAAQQASRRLSQIREELGAELAVALRFTRISSRFYFVIAAEHHEEMLSDRIKAFLNGPWGSHFVLLS